MKVGRPPSHGKYQNRYELEYAVRYYLYTKKMSIRAIARVTQVKRGVIEYILSTAIKSQINSDTLFSKTTSERTQHDQVRQLQQTH